MAAFLPSLFYSKKLKLEGQKQHNEMPSVYFWVYREEPLRTEVFDQLKHIAFVFKSMFFTFLPHWAQGN